jgi:hypothetical protein
VRATGPADPAVVLARLMSLHGSVDLAQHLDASLLRGLGSSAAPSLAARAAVRALVEEIVLGLRAGLDDTFADPFQRRSRLPTPAEVMAAVVKEGAAERIWAPCGELVTRTLGRVRFELGALREEMGPALAALGPSEARLEQLDAALFAATAEGRAALEDRLLAELARSFARRFAVAITTLPEALAPSHFAPWFARGGLLRDALDAGRDVVLGILEHDHRRLAALVAAPSHE